MALGDPFGCGFLVTLGGFHAPRRFGAAEEHWHELVIVRGHLPVIVRGLCLPCGEPKATLVDCACH